MIVIEGSGDWPVWGKALWLSMGPLMLALVVALDVWLDKAQPEEEAKK